MSLFLLLIKFCEVLPRLHIGRVFTPLSTSMSALSLSIKIPPLLQNMENLLALDILALVR